MAELSAEGETTVVATVVAAPPSTGGREGVPTVVATVRQALEGASSSRESRRESGGRRGAGANKNELRHNTYARCTLVFIWR